MDSQPRKALFGLENEYPELEGLGKEIIRRKIRRLKMRLHCPNLSKMYKSHRKRFQQAKKGVVRSAYSMIPALTNRLNFYSVLYESFPNEKLLRSTPTGKWIFLWSINIENINYVIMTLFANKRGWFRKKTAGFEEFQRHIVQKMTHSDLLRGQRSGKVKVTWPQSLKIWLFYLVTPFIFAEI